MMHTALNRGALENAGDPLFFVDAPHASGSATAQPVSIHRGYGMRQGPNWIAIATIAGLHFLVLFALVKLDVISVVKPKPVVTVVELIAEPAPPPMEKPKEEPVRIEKVVPLVQAPVAVVQTVAPPPPPIAVTTTPPPAKPVLAPAPSTAPASVGNLETMMISGQPPRYPMESRRKHESGTVVLDLTIGTDGSIVQVGIRQSSGFARLDSAAMEAARKWRFRPMIRDGVAVMVRGPFSLPFNLG